MISFSNQGRLAPASASATSRAGPFPRRAGAVELLCRVFLTRYCRLTIRGSIPDLDRPVLICANHRSHLDSIAVMTALGLPFRKCGILAARDYFFPMPAWLGIGAKSLSLIAVERQERRPDFARTIEACAAFLAAGGTALLAYPEGTRRTAPGIAPFKRGPALLAVSLLLPVLPVYLAGSDRILGKGRRFPRPGRIEIAVGSPIWPATPGTRIERRAGSIRLCAQIEEEVRSLARKIGT